MFNYWEECIAEGLCDVGLKATEEQIKELAEFVEGSHENYGLEMGYDVASANCESEEALELKKLKKEIEDKRMWELNTEPCKRCTTTGSVRGVDCPNCYGKGRKKRYRL